MSTSGNFADILAGAATAKPAPAAVKHEFFEDAELCYQLSVDRHALQQQAGYQNGQEEALRRSLISDITIRTYRLGQKWARGAHRIPVRPATPSEA